MAIVTGGGRGIGRAVAERLAGDGAAVVLTGRDGVEAKAAAQAIRDSGGRALGLAADQGSSVAWTEVVGSAVKEFGRLDILVANAGVSAPHPIDTMSLEEFRAINRTNLRGPFLGLRAAVSAMIEQGHGGSVVLIGSIVGKIGAASFSAYAAAKDGVRLMAKAAALEFGDRGIRVNSVHPGFVRTQMSAAFPEAALASMIPLERFGETRDIAGAVSFLASDRSRFMTGAELVVDGGWIAK